MRWFLLLLGVISCSAFSQQLTQADQFTKGEERTLPTMRAVDRDWAYFKSVSCDDIGQVVFHSRSEEILLAKRKSQCLNQYKAFLPVPIPVRR
ncbi:MAG: hypothetical protein V3T17_19220 [Pseudomonadales bacterium]